MTVKIVDSDSAINLMERLKCLDCSQFFRMYRTVLTDVVEEETGFHRYLSEPWFESHRMTQEERKLAESIGSSFLELGPGERSVIAHALYMSNEMGGERIMLISDDKEARHIFERVLSKSHDIKGRFPNLGRIQWVRSEDVLRRMMERDLFDEVLASQIYEELCLILGPKRLSFLRE